ncbi:hypothetical protein ACHAXH_004788, partial [Discostella pseudostelligera]
MTMADFSSLSSSSASSDLMAAVESAAQLPNGAKRDAALIEALRTCRKELDDAKRECYAARLRVSEAKDKFDSLAIILAGIDPSTYLSSSSTSDLIIGDGSGDASTVKRGAPCSPNRQSNEKLPKLSSPSSMTSMEDGGGMDIPATPIPTNPIHIPARYTGYSTTPSEQAMIDTHRDNFYRKLLGIPATEIENYTPPPTQANLRSKSQLDEGIHIARHWDTGDDELDAAAFRSRHKTWYSKMKPVTRDVGRRTGIHLRTLEPTLQSPPSSHGFRDGETFLCRYNKNGTKSILYIDVTQLFDALFEIHCLEQNHVRGNNAVKLRVDELYANITDGQVKTFLDTCPVCIERRGRPTTEL